MRLLLDTHIFLWYIWLTGGAITEGTPAIGAPAELLADFSKFILNRDHAVICGHHAGRALTRPGQTAFRTVGNADAIAELPRDRGQGFGGCLVRDGNVEVNEHRLGQIRTVSS